jgi:VCBS repeat-containing protein
MRNVLLVILLSPLLFAADQPRFGWKPAGAETFALNATEHKSFSIPQQGKWRFELKADTAVYVGVASAEQVGRIRYVTLADYRGFSCVSTKLVAGTVDCEVQQSGEQVIVRDERGPFTKGAGMIGSVRKTSEAETDRATKPNTITLTLYKWACLENCK